MIREIDSENQKADICTIGLHGELFVSIRKFSMRLVILQVRGIVSRNGIFGPK